MRMRTSGIHDQLQLTAGGKASAGTIVAAMEHYAERLQIIIAIAVDND
jgi:hypothetical protein